MIDKFVESFIEFYHPIWEHLHGLADEDNGLLFVVGKGHGICNGETLIWSLQILASIISAVLTALGATSCMGY